VNASAVKDEGRLEPFEMTLEEATTLIMTGACFARLGDPTETGRRCRLQTRRSRPDRKASGEPVWTPVAHPKEREQLARAECKSPLGEVQAEIQR